MAKSGYELSRVWFDWCFENPEKISPNHTALYFFCIEHCNRLGWKEKFGLPTTMAKEAIGIKNYKTYIKTLNDLIEFGFITLIEKSKNQYSANIIALSKNTEAHGEALTKALTKATTKHMAKQVQSIVSIDKPITINQEPITKSVLEHTRDLSFYGNFETVSKNITEDEIFLTEAAHLLNTTIETVKEFSEKKLLEMKATGAISRYSVSAIRGFILKDFKQQKEKEPKLKDNSAGAMLAQLERIRRKNGQL
jgi:hypothetical protein